MIQLARKASMITHLIAMKADVNATNDAGWTLLKRLTMEIATEDDSMQCLKAAVNAGANTDTRIHDSYTIKGRKSENKQVLSDSGLKIQTLTEEKVATTDADKYLREFEVAEAAV